MAAGMLDERRPWSKKNSWWRRLRAPRHDSFGVEDEDDEAERMAAFDLDGEVYSGGEATAGTN